MAKHVAFLRGINLGARNKVGMAALRELVHGLGYDDAATHLQSGNLVFTARKAAAQTEAELSKAIEAGFGFPVAVTVRTVAQLRTVVEGNPFAEHTNEPAKLMVVFLTKKAAVKGLDPDDYAPDEYAVKGREIYLWLPNGSHKSKLGIAFWEKRTGAVGTLRNWSTVTKMLELAG